MAGTAETSQFRELSSARKVILLVITVALVGAGCTTPPATSPVQPSSYEARAQRTSPPKTFKGRVISIEDGDTIVIVDDGNRTYKIRLQGIDAPEGGQPFGNRSSQNLSDAVFGKQIEVEWFKRDRYGRIVGKVLIDGGDVCLQQIEAGLAWHYKYYQNEQSAIDRERYANAEDGARATRRELWSDENPMPPWRFRRMR